MDCYFRQSWKDTRLAYDPTAYKGNPKNLALSVSMLDKIWKPDTYFYNGKNAYIHTITNPNKFVRIASDGVVLYSSRWDYTVYTTSFRFAWYSFCIWHLFFHHENDIQIAHKKTDRQLNKTRSESLNLCTLMYRDISLRRSRRTAVKMTVRIQFAKNRETRVRQGQWKVVETCM